MKVTLFDSIYHKQLLPLTYTRPVAKLRVGILTIQEKWDKFASVPVSIRTQEYLSQAFKSNLKRGGIGINASVLPNTELIEEISELNDKQLLVKNGKVIAINPLPAAEDDLGEVLASFKQVESQVEFNQIENTWDIFKLNDLEIKADLGLLKEKSKFVTPSATNTIIGDEVYIEEGAIVECAILNSTTGPIYVASGAEIMEGSVVRGSLAMLKGSVLKLGTKIYGATTLGPYTKVGGEVNNSVFQGYSNKGHDGFLGNSVIGEWCNLGADTNNSNLKNNYSNVKVWNYLKEDFVDTGIQFCGLIMGDHSKSAINTMFNTGTVVGVNANVFGSGFPAKFIPSYSWGNQELVEYNFEKSIEVAKVVCERRHIALGIHEEAMLKHVFEESKKYR
jgi:UDP-N-acetylglucosamine diphosphorylase/glucosamine-1-phosphate N-acetyltransferase